MLSFANINEAWGETRKKQKQTTIDPPKMKKETENSESVQCGPNFGSACTPIVIRITDPAIVKELSIYNDDYRHDVIMDIIKNALYKKVEAQYKETQFKVQKEQIQNDVVRKIEIERPSIITQVMSNFLDEEYTEIISVVAISIFLLFLIEGIKKYNKI